MTTITNITTDQARTPPLSSQSRAAGGSLLEAPRPVIRGAKSQDDLTDVSIDWLRMSGSRYMLEHVLHLTETLFGDTKADKGRFLLDTGYKWAAGGVFLDTKKSNPANHCVVDLPASLLMEISELQLRQLIYDLHSIGFKTTRIDIACDYHDRPYLIDDALQSCEAGELCRSRTFQLIETKNNRSTIGRTLTIGKRGKDGSGRCVRIYDKGLETQTLEEGHWIRWETELADSCANDFSMAYAQSKDPIDCAHAHALWAVEFREYNGSRELNRRPLTAWFSDLVDNKTRRRLTATRTKSTVASYTHWMRTSVLPKLKTISAITGNPLVGVIDHVCGQVNPRPDHTQCVKVRTICRSLGANNHQITKFGLYSGVTHE
ncbi:MAG: replication initiation factor domain-containing protein [Phycisphaerales bacterium]|nr:replication initiation factor domain-containing protein [Phycisphaerales bacterium]